MRNSFKQDPPGEHGESGEEIGMLLICIPLQGLLFAMFCHFRHHVAKGLIYGSLSL